jgi:hypothetical protein
MNQCSAVGAVATVRVRKQYSSHLCEGGSAINSDTK